MWYIQAMEYDSAMKRNKVLISAVTWMNLGDMLSEMQYDSTYMKYTD